MPAALPDDALDGILATQLLIAWAGEQRFLKWWKTDLIDNAAGGDLLSRLLPQTHEWAALQAVREAARRVDQRARERLGDADQVRSLFFLGFEVDEQLDDRLKALKRAGKTPAEALSFRHPLGDTFDKMIVVPVLTDASVSFVVVPNARHVKGPRPADPGELVRRLAAALVPLADQYPLPFYKLETKEA